MGLFDAVTGGYFASKQASRARSSAKAFARQAHQIEVADLRKAGLNPILSATGGRGTSTPGMAAAAQPNFSALAMTRAQIKNIDANTGLVNAKAGAIDPAAEIGGVLGDMIRAGVSTAKDVNAWMNKNYQKESTKSKYKTPGYHINIGDQDSIGNYVPRK